VIVRTNETAGLHSRSIAALDLDSHASRKRTVQFSLWRTSVSRQEFEPRRTTRTERLVSLSETVRSLQFSLMLPARHSVTAWTSFTRACQRLTAVSAFHPSLPRRLSAHCGQLFGRSARTRFH
jgi:hypothetical protein